MRVLFAYSVYDVHSSKTPLRSPDDTQFGLSYISALLKEHGHETSLIVLARPLGKRNEKTINQRVAKFAPDLICLTAVSSEYRFIEDTARYIRARFPAAYLLIGGVHVSLNAREEMLDVFDVLCVGEGEYPTLELVTQLERGEQPSGIPNLWIRHDGAIQKNETRPFLEDLDHLPRPDRQMWNEWIDARPGSRRTVLLDVAAHTAARFAPIMRCRECRQGPTFGSDPSRASSTRSATSSPSIRR
jgi:anaerobic magnesium-protoporphyrin IX monomethyl ester cyclase